MNEEINIEQQLQAELIRLKKAIEYIEQAEGYVQKAQLLNNETQSKCEEVLKSNEDLKSEILAVKSATNKKYEQITSDLDKHSKTVSMQNKIIEQNRKEIERLKSLKWYQKLFG
jgi:ribosomal protein S8